MRRKKDFEDPQAPGPDEAGQAVPADAGGEGPYRKHEPIKVSFTVYIVSIVLVALVIFILMLVQYLPGYKSYRQLEDACRNADYIYVGMRISTEELGKRKKNPLSEEYLTDIENIFKDMGVKKVRVEINPDDTKIPFDPSADSKD